MFRNLAVAIFIIPKLVVWPLLWLYRCRLKKRRGECDCGQEEDRGLKSNEC